ncbi:MAG: thioredoxin family protein [Pseudomonadota bacterium]
MDRPQPVGIAVAAKSPAPPPRPVATPTRGGKDWNDAQIQWQPFDVGVQAAQVQNKPVCLVFFTEWCPHCTNYAAVFHDPRVVEQAKNFVMIRLDKDKNSEISSRFAPDGEYIPRTYFLTSDGTLDATIQVARPQFKYFYDEKSPEGILAGMAAALEKLK